MCLNFSERASDLALVATASGEIIIIIIIIVENGTEGSSIILHAPVDTRDFITGEIFTHTGNSNPTVQDHVLEFSLQTPKTSNIQGIITINLSL